MQAMAHSLQMSSVNIVSQISINVSSSTNCVTLSSFLDAQTASLGIGYLVYISTHSVPASWVCFRLTESRIDERLVLCLRLVEGFAVDRGCAAKVVHFLPGKYAPDSIRN